MRTYKIIHTADLHLGSMFSSTPEIAKKRQSEQLDVLRNISRLAAENQTDALFIAGDLFDSSSVEEQLLSEVKSILSQMRCRVFISPGNHDPATPDSCYFSSEWPDNVHIFGNKLECVRLEEKKVCVWGIGFGKTYEPESLFDGARLDDNYINVLVMHGELVPDENYGSKYNPVTRAQFRQSKFSYIALGHIHKCMFPKEGEPNIYNPGCPEGRGFDELDDKGVLIGYLGLGFADVKFQSVCKRKYLSERIDVSGCTATSEFCEKIVKELSAKYEYDYSDNIYDITLTGALPKGIMPDLRAISVRLRSDICYARLNDLTTVKLDATAYSKDNTLRGAFVRNIIGKLEKDPANRDKYYRALFYGLQAFDGDVKLQD